MVWQMQWMGAKLGNLRILVCCRCLDVPSEQKRAIVVPADPMPVIQPRTQDYYDAETNLRAISAPTVYDLVTGIPVPGTTTLVTQDGQNLSTQNVGIPADLDPGAVMPLQGTTAYHVAIPLTSVYSLGDNTVYVTCPSAHGLSTGAQIIAQGLTNKHACGAYNVTVTTGTAFNYTANVVIPSGPLLAGTSQIVTANVGLPLDFVQLPQTGL